MICCFLPPDTLLKTATLIHAKPGSVAKLQQLQARSMKHTLLRLIPLERPLGLAALFLTITSGAVAEWDAIQWPAPVQQAFAEALVWDIAAYSLDDEEEKRGEQQCGAALNRALELAKAASAPLYAEVLTAAAERSLSDGGSLSDLRESAFAMIDAAGEAATLETIQQVVPPDVSPEVRGLLKAMQEDAAKKQESATNSAIASLSTMLGSPSDQDLAWCIEAIKADPNCLPAWALLTRVGENQVCLYAAKQWAERDTANGMPLIVVAAIELEQTTGLVTDRPLKRLEHAATIPIIDWPKFLGPKEFDLTYPDAERFRKLGVVGKPVMASALYQLNDFGFTTSHLNSFRPLVSAYCDEDISEFTQKQFNPVLRRRAVPVLSRLAATVMDRSADSIVDFLAANRAVTGSLNLWSPADEIPKRTPAETAFRSAVTESVARFRKATAEMARLAGEDEDYGRVERLMCEGNFDGAANDRAALADIRKRFSFTDLVEAVLVERGYVTQ